MNNEFIVIKGRLKLIKREKLKEKIKKAGHTFQTVINTKTTIVVEGVVNVNKKKKYNKNIKVMTEEEFIEFLKEKKKKEKKEITKKTKKLLNKQNIMRILVLVLIIQSIRYTDTLLSCIIAICASLLVLPDISNKYYSNIVFKVTLPISLFMIAFAFNFEKEKSMVYGTWYVDTLTLTINKTEIKLDVIDSNGRHLLAGKRKTKNDKLVITTDYKNYYFEYDEQNDSLCYLKDKENCAYYLKRIN